MTAKGDDGGRDRSPLAHRVIRQLLEYPINTPLGIQRAWVAAEHVKTRASREVARFVKAARNPGWAVQKVIERLSASAHRQ